MLHRRHRLTMHIALLLVACASTAVARWHPAAGSDASGRPSLVVTSQGPTVHEVTVTIPGVELEEVTVDGRSLVRVTIPGCESMLETGAPALPVLARALPLPAHGTPTIEVVSAVWRTVSELPPLPSRGSISRAVDPAQIPFVFGAAYDSEKIWPARVASVGRPFLVRDKRGVPLHINPVRWDPVGGRLEALEQLTVRVTTRGDGGINVVDRPVASAGKSFAPFMRAVFGANETDKVDDGGGSDGEGHGYGESGRMMIVTSAAMVNAASEFATWKRENGYAVDVVSMDALGGTVLGLRMAIDERYFSPDGLAYLVLIGDLEQVPTCTGSYHGADSDGMYGLLSGDDLYVDVLVSRFPARSVTEAYTMLGRSIAYERDVAAGASWCARAVGIASDEGNPTDYERAELLRDDLLAAGLTDVARIYQGFGGNTAVISATLNAGTGLVNYLGHGSGDAWLSVPFENSDIHALTNTDAWPWIIDVSCSNGDFSRPECFAEAWLRSNHGGDPAGAVAILSASTDTSWEPPCVMQTAMIEALVDAGETNLGALYAAGVAAVLVMYDGLPHGQKLMEQYNLFGDTTLRVRWQAPEPLTVTHDSSLPAGYGAWTVLVPQAARAVLTSGSELLAHAEATATGVVSLEPSRALVAGEMVRLTVTADHVVTYQVDLPVVTAPTAAEEVLPAVTALAGNWPNPFNPSTTVGFAVAAPTQVRLSVHDARGRLVSVLVDEVVAAGSHRVVWNGRDRGGRAVASGVYVAHLTADGQTQVTKMTLAR